MPGANVVTAFHLIVPPEMTDFYVLRVSPNAARFSAISTIQECSQDKQKYQL